MLALINSGTGGKEILFVIIFVLVAVAVILLLIRSIRRERIRYGIDKAKSEGHSKESFDKLILSLFEGRKREFVLFELEICGEKEIVKTYGDRQYELLVGQIIERLNKVLPATAKLCLYEKDVISFVIIDDIDNKIVADIASLVIMECVKPIHTMSHASITAEVNIGVVSSSLCDDHEQLRNNSILALSSSKQSGVNNYIIYSEALNTNSSQEFQYYIEIKNAIANNQFVLYYQPIVNVNSKQVIAYESLLRWNHPTLGVLSPAKFIDILEQTGDIHWVGFWAFEQLVMVANNYCTKNPDSDLLFTLNLSPKQLMNSKLVEELRRIVKKHKLEPRRIVIEIVEFAMFDKLDVVKSNISKLRMCGFLLAIDDFGLEMSSLKLLEETDVDYIKLDRAFVADSQDNNLMSGIVTALINYASTHNKIVVAEGIEDAIICEYVQSCHIQYAQGYLFGKPQPRELLPI